MVSPILSMSWYRSLDMNWFRHGISYPYHLFVSIIHVLCRIVLRHCWHNIDFISFTYSKESYYDMTYDETSCTLTLHNDFTYIIRATHSFIIWVRTMYNRSTCYTYYSSVNTQRNMTKDSKMSFLISCFIIIISYQAISENVFQNSFMILFHGRYDYYMSYSTNRVHNYTCTKG